MTTLRSARLRVYAPERTSRAAHAWATLWKPRKSRSAKARKFRILPILGTRASDPKQTLEPARLPVITTASKSTRRISEREYLSAAIPHWWRQYASATAPTSLPVPRSRKTSRRTVWASPAAGKSTNRAGLRASAANWPQRNIRTRKLALAGNRKHDRRNSGAAERRAHACAQPTDPARRKT